MTVVIGKEITEFQTNLPLVDYEQYSSTKTYNKGDKVTFRNKNYICTANNTLNKNPEKYDGSVWIGTPTNVYAMFEAKANVVTNFTDRMTLSFPISQINKICLFDLKAEKITINIQGESWGKKTIEENLRQDIIRNFHDYLYANFNYKSICEYSFPMLYDGNINIELEAENFKGRLGCIIVGKEEYLGRTLYGGSLGIQSFSKKERNVWGDMIIKQGNTYRLMDMPVLIEEHELDFVYNTLKKIESTPSVFLADPSEKKENLRVLGIFRDLEIPVLNGSSVYNLRVESII